MFRERGEPVNAAESFFGRNDYDNSVAASSMPSRCAQGLLALRVPDTQQYAPSAITALSHDGCIAAVGGRDTELYLWDVLSGNLLTKITGHDIHWASSRDISFFVTCQEDGSVVMWDRESMRMQMVLGEVHEGISCLSISPSDRVVVCGGGKGGVYSWDSSTGREANFFDGGHTGPVAYVQCCTTVEGDEVVVSCGASDHTIVVWDLQGGDKLLQMTISELQAAKNIKYDVSTDSRLVLMLCVDAVPFPNLFLVHLSTGAKRSLSCHDGIIRHGCLGRDADTFVTCGSDSKVVLWDTDSMEPRFTMSGHVGPVVCVDVNAAGDRIVSAGEDCSLRLWSALDGQQLMVFEAQDEPIKMVAFARGSGSRVISSDISGRTYVWSLHSEFLLELIRRYVEVVSCFTLSTDLRSAVLGCNNGRVMLWDMESRELQWEYSHHTGRVEAASFNSSLSMVATVGADGCVAVIQVQDGKQANSFTGNDNPLVSVAFSPDDERIASNSADGKVLVFLVNSHSRKARLVLENQISRVTCFVFSPNSKLIVGCGADGSVLVWNVNTGSISTALEGEAAAATCCCFDLIGKLLAVGNVMGNTLLFNLETAELLCELKGNASPVREITFNRDTTKLTTVCSRQAIIWDMSTAQKSRLFDFVIDSTGDFKAAPHPYRTTISHTGTILFDHESEAVIYDMQALVDPGVRSFFLSDTRAIAAGSGASSRIAVWSAHGNSAPDKYHTTHDAITSTAFSNDDSVVVMGTQDGMIVIYDVVHNETIDVIPAHQNGPCRCVRLSADNSEILSCGADSKVTLWDWRTRTPTRIYSGHFISIGCCDLAEQGDRVVSGDNHGMICVWEKDTGKVVQTLPLAHTQAVLSVSMSADGSTVASVGADDKVSIWNVDLGIELVSLSLAIESQPLYCAFSPDGNKLAVTESNGNVLIWNVRAGCQWTILTGAHKGKVSCCDWSADCRRFVTSGADSTLAIWDAESGAQLFRFNLKSGPLTTCSVSPQGLYVASGSSSGTLSVCNVAHSLRATPEPSFLYHWLSNQDPQQAVFQFVRLYGMFSHIINVQDARGWSLLLHAVSRGNAAVASMIFDVLEPSSTNQVGAISAVPFSIQTRVKFHNQDNQGLGGGSEHFSRIDNEAESTAHSVRREQRMSTIGGAAQRQRRKSTISGVGILGTGTGMMHDGFGTNNTALLNLAASQSNMGSFLNLRKGSAVRRLPPHGIHGSRHASGGQGLGEGTEPEGDDFWDHTSGSGKFTGWGCSSGAKRLRLAASSEQQEVSGLDSNSPQNQHHHHQHHPWYQGHQNHFPLQQQQQQPHTRACSSHTTLAAPPRLRHAAGSRSFFSQPAAIAEATEGSGKLQAPRENSMGAVRMGRRPPSLSVNTMKDDNQVSAWSSPRVQILSPAKTRRMSVAAFFGGTWGGGEDEEEITPGGNKSFSHNLRKVAVELFTEKREIDEVDLIQNNALALALNSKSSMCVQVILDAVCMNKVSLGSYHAITDIIPSLALRYPIMCYMFLASLEVRHLADLEVPVAVLKGIDESVIRTAPIFTNVKSLWQGHLKLHEVRSGPQPYAHVKASMVLLPYACSIGRESLLQTLVESDVPVKAFGTPSIRAVIKHKWRLYARDRIAFRAVAFMLYVLIFTAFAILYAQEDTSVDIRTYWLNSSNGKVHLIMDILLFSQTCWYAWTELSQMYAIGLHYYIRNYWNVLDMASIILMLLINPFHVMRIGVGQRQALSPMIAFELLLVYFKTLFFGLAFEPTGPFIHMVLQIGWGIRTFVVLLAMTCCCFSTALLVLYQYVSPTTDVQFSNFGASSMTMWRAVLGQFDMSGAYSTGWSQITLIIFSVFMFTVQILLLNMLISVMRDVYIKVRCDEEDVFLKGRAMIIIEIESLMTTKQLDRFSNMPPYVHLLTPVNRKERDKDAGSSDGRLEKLETMMLKLSELVTSNRSGSIKHEGGPDSPRTTTALSFARPSTFGTGQDRDKMLRERVIEGLNTDGMSAEQTSYLQLLATRLRDADQLAGILRQIDRLQRTVNTQEMRLEGVVTVLRDIEALLRNQQPVIIHQESRPSVMRKNTTLTPAELEAEVKKMLGNSPERLPMMTSPARNRKPYTPFEVEVDRAGDVTINMSGKALHTLPNHDGAPDQPSPASLDYEPRLNVAFADRPSSLTRVPELRIADRPSIVSRDLDRSILDGPTTRTPDTGTHMSRGLNDRPSSTTRNGNERPSSATRSGFDRPSSVTRATGDRPSSASRSVPAVAVDQTIIPGSIMSGGGSSGDRSSDAREEGVMVEDREPMPWEENFSEVIGSGSGSERGGMDSYRSDGTPSRRSDGSGSLAPARILSLKPLPRSHLSPPPQAPSPPPAARAGVQPLRSSAQLPATGMTIVPPSPMRY